MNVPERTKKVFRVALKAQQRIHTNSGIRAAERLSRILNNQPVFGSSVLDGWKPDSGSFSYKSFETPTGRVRTI